MPLSIPESEKHIYRTMNRKSIFTILTFLITCLFFSCKEEEIKQYVIGVSQCSDDLWRETVNKEMLREASFYPNFTIHIKSVHDDTQKQIEDIEYFISEKVDLLVVAPNESEAITPVVRKALDKNIPVILLDRKVNLDNYTAYVGADNYKLSYELGDYVANLLNGSGKVVEMRGWKGSTTDDERHQGFHDAIKKFPDIEVISQKRGNFLRDPARIQMEIVLQELDDIDLVFAMNDQMALGVSEALGKYSGRRPYIIGIDALPGEGGGIEYISKGIIDASFIYPTGGDKVIETAHQILSGKPYTKNNMLFTSIVDRSNVRVIQLQGDQINEQQKKFDRLNVLLSDSTIRYSNQRTLFLVSLVIIALITLLLFMAFIAYQIKRRTNMKLYQRNIEIQNQAKILESQKQQLVELSAQLEEATNAKLTFFTNISHELKTPLSLITGPVEVLLSEKEMDSRHLKLLKYIKRNSDRLLSLISEIIEFRRYDNHKQPIFYSDCDLSKYLVELNSYFTELAVSKGVSLEFYHNGFDYIVQLDVAKFEKAYFNLLSNAFRHVNLNGRIEVRISRHITDESDLIEISVFNTGSFIPSDYIGNIFNRFYKAGNKEGSTGIGLALTKSIVELHKGSIRVESIENVGTIFTVNLPFILSDNKTKENVLSYETMYTQHKLSLLQNKPLETDILEWSEKTSLPMILLIEDNPDMLLFISDILKDQYSVIKACDGEEGIQKAMKYVPDIIISDVMMPFRDGFEVCRILKENISTNHIPIIMLTALSLDKQKAMGFENGADAYISKPFNPEILKIRIRKLLENRAKLKETFGSSWIQEDRSSLAHSEQDFINKFRAYVENNILQEELSVNDIASHMGLSRAQLYRKVKSITDHSPLDLIILSRLHYARNLMFNSDKTMSEIAYGAGFSSPSVFSKTFKRYYKQSPVDFLKANNNY